MAELDYKVEKLGAENDHTLKANKLLAEKIEKIKELIGAMHARLKDAQESYIDLSTDHVNYFDKNEKVLLDKKIENFQLLLEKALEAGKFVQDLLANIDAYRTKPFPYSYANHQKKLAGTSDQFGSSDMVSRKKDERFILKPEQKRDKLIDGIFEEMRKNHKIPTFYLSTCTKLQKLKLIRDHFQNLYKE